MNDREQAMLDIANVRDTLILMGEYLGERVDRQEASTMYLLANTLSRAIDAINGPSKRAAGNDA